MADGTEGGAGDGRPPRTPGALAREIAALAAAAEALGMTLTAATLHDALRWCAAEAPPQPGDDGRPLGGHP